MPFLITAGPSLQLSGVVYDLLLGQAATFTFNASGVLGLARITVVSETFPAEWAFVDNGDNTATLSTAATLTVGSFSITLRCIDAARQPITATFNVSVINVETPFDPCAAYAPPADPEAVDAGIGISPTGDALENVTTPTGGTFEICEAIV